MYSALSTNIVEVLGEGNLYAVNGASESKNIQPYTVVIETTPGWFEYGCKKQYKAYDFRISDPEISSGQAEDIDKLEFNISSVSSFKTRNESNVGCNLSYQLNKACPEMKALAAASSSLNMRIKEGGFIIKTVNVPAFRKAIKDWVANQEENGLISLCLKDRRNRLGVIIEVLETIDGTVIEFTRKRSGNTALSSETQGLGLDAGTVTKASFRFDKGTVLACRWQPLGVNTTTLKFFLDLSCSGNSKEIPVIQMRGSAENSQELAVNQSGQEGNDADKVKTKRDRILLELDLANKLKDAVCTVMESNTDIKALLIVCSSKSEKTQTFQGQLNKSEAVWTLLELVGFQLKDENIEIKFDGQFPTLIPVLLESLSVIERKEDRELIQQCNAYQRQELLRIINKVMENETIIPFDSKFKEELQKKPVEDILAVLNFKIDYSEDKLSPPSQNTCVLEAMFYLLKFL